MAELTPFILAIAGLIISIFGFFIKQGIDNNKEQINELKKAVAELTYKVHESEKREQRISSDLGHAIETMHDIKELVKEKL